MIVDTRGTVCPQPLIATKKAINGLTQESSIEVLLDNDMAFRNVGAYLSELGIAHTVKPDRIVFTASPMENKSIPSTCLIPATASYAVVINSLTMGKGEDDLGKILLKAFLSTVAQEDKLPSHLLFYNEGVQLCAEGSSVLELLQTLEEKGVTLIVCGTCVDYFGLKERIAVGTISNMYKIVEILQSVSKVIYP